MTHPDEPRGHRIGDALRLGVEASALLAFLGLMVLGVAVHEPWFDEAQSWLLARDASLADLLGHFLRYEGHPPLWYLILAIPAKLGLPFKSINVVSAAIATVGVVLVLRMREVPLPVRALVPFTFYVAYQYTIVSRSYVLLLPLLSLVLAIYPRRRERLWTFVVLLVLMSLVSLHGMSLAGGLTILYAIDHWPERREIARLELRRHLLALGALVANVVAVALMLVPPQDLAIQAALKFEFSVARLSRMAWYGIGSNLFGTGLLSLAAILVLGWWLWSRRSFATFAVLVLSILPISVVYFNRWHEGIFFLALLFAILLAYQRKPAGPPGRRERWLDAAASGVVVLFLVVHVSWALASYRYDISEAFSGSQEAADYIAEHHLDQAKLFGAGFPSIGVEPYFESNVFANYRTTGGFSFWDWSTRSPWFYMARPIWRADRMVAWTEAQLDEEPDFILVTRKFRSDALYDQVIARDARFELVKTFRGAMFWKDAVVENESFNLYARARREGR